MIFRLSPTEFIHMYKVKEERFDVKTNNNLHYDIGQKRI